MGSQILIIFGALFRTFWTVESLSQALSHAAADVLCFQYEVFQNSKALPSAVTTKPEGAKTCSKFLWNKCDGEGCKPFTHGTCNDAPAAAAPPVPGSPTNSEGVAPASRVDTNDEGNEDQGPDGDTEDDDDDDDDDDVKGTEAPAPPPEPPLKQSRHSKSVQLLSQELKGKDDAVALLQAGMQIMNDFFSNNDSTSTGDGEAFVGKNKGFKSKDQKAEFLKCVTAGLQVLEEAKADTQKLSRTAGEGGCTSLVEIFCGKVQAVSSIIQCGVELFTGLFASCGKKGPGVRTVAGEKVFFQDGPGFFHHFNKSVRLLHGLFETGSNTVKKTGNNNDGLSPELAEFVAELEGKEAHIDGYLKTAMYLMESLFAGPHKDIIIQTLGASKSPGGTTGDIDFNEMSGNIIQGAVALRGVVSISDGKKKPGVRFLCEVITHVIEKGVCIIKGIIHKFGGGGCNSSSSNAEPSSQQVRQLHQVKLGGKMYMSPFPSGHPCNIEGYNHQQCLKKNKEELEQEQGNSAPEASGGPSSEKAEGNSEKPLPGALGAPPGGASASPAGAASAAPPEAAPATPPEAAPAEPPEAAPAEPPEAAPAEPPEAAPAEPPEAAPAAPPEAAPAEPPEAAPEAPPEAAPAEPPEAAPEAPPEAAPAASPTAQTPVNRTGEMLPEGVPTAVPKGKKRRSVDSLSLYDIQPVGFKAIKGRAAGAKPDNNLLFERLGQSIGMVEVLHKVGRSALEEEGVVFKTPEKEDPSKKKKPGTGGSKIGTRIVGGTKVKKYKYPSIVLVKHKNLHICSGTILNKDWVVTAAHCIETQVPSHYTIVAAEYNKEEDDGHEQQATVTKIIKHKQYSPETQANDICLFQISPSLKLDDKVKPVALPDQEFNPKGGTYMWFAGWGKLGADKDTPDILQEVSIPIVALKECKKKLEGYLVTKKQICAGFEEGGKDTCQGDSGGPMYFIEKNIQVLAGVVSWGIGCAEPGMPAVYTRVSAYLDWISANIISGKGIMQPSQSLGKGIRPGGLYGAESSPHKFPSVVLITASGDHICSGTIISKNWVVTAAHCLKSKEVGVYKLVAAEFNQEQTEGMERILTVLTIIEHSGYNPHTMENDIALLKINPPLAFNDPHVQKALLPSENYFPKSDLVSVGWGKLSENAGISPLLQEVVVKPVPEGVCFKWLHQPNLYIDKIICTAFEGTHTDICQGESGGPLYDVRGGHHFLVGISSWGQPCAKSNAPRVYTKVSQYLYWIQSQMKAASMGRTAVALQGGARAEEGIFKSIAILKVNGEHRCSVSIIHKEWVLTAAHCITSDKESDYAVIAGSYDKGKKLDGEQTVMLTRIVLHDKYTELVGTNDVALLKVNPPLEWSLKVQPAVLPTRVDKTKQDVTVVGWSVNGRSGPNILQATALTLTNLSDCPIPGVVSPKKVFCVRSVDGVNNPCIGDSGGPLYNMNGALQKLIGIAKTRPCDPRDAPAAFTNIYRYIPWILLNVNEDPLTTAGSFEGRDIFPGEFPSIAIIQDQNGHPICPGTLLNQDFLLTASSCVVGKPTSSLVVRAGIYDLNQIDSMTEQVSHVAAVYENEELEGAEEGNNIALVKLTTSFIFGRSIASAKQHHLLGTLPKTLTTMGWGTDWGLKKVRSGQRFSLKESKRCRNVKEHPESFLCLQNGKHAPGLCVGDRGSPVFTEQGNLYAVISSTKTCGRGGNPSNAIKIASNENVTSWIFKTMERSKLGGRDTTINTQPKGL